MEDTRWPHVPALTTAAAILRVHVMVPDAQLDEEEEEEEDKIAEAKTAAAKSGKSAGQKDAVSKANKSGSGGASAKALDCMRKPPEGMEREVVSPDMCPKAPLLSHHVRFVVDALCELGHHAHALHHTFCNQARAAREVLAVLAHIAAKALVLDRALRAT